MLSARRATGRVILSTRRVAGVVVAVLTAIGLSLVGERGSGFNMFTKKKRVLNNHFSSAANLSESCKTVSSRVTTFSCITC